LLCYKIYQEAGEVVKRDLSKKGGKTTTGGFKRKRHGTGGTNKKIRIEKSIIVKEARGP